MNIKVASGRAGHYLSTLSFLYLFSSISSLPFKSSLYTSLPPIQFSVIPLFSFMLLSFFFSLCVFALCFFAFSVLFFPFRSFPSLYLHIFLSRASLSYSLSSLIPLALINLFCFPLPRMSIVFFFSPASILSDLFNFEFLSLHLSMLFSSLLLVFSSYHFNFTIF